MAQKVQVLLIDDLDGSQADETVTFALDGKGYEIDLNGANAEAFRKKLGPFLAKARRCRAMKATAGTQKGAVSHDDTAVIRAWARENGHHVNERGRIPVEVMEAFRRRDTSNPTPVRLVPERKGTPHEVSTEARLEEAANKLPAPTGPQLKLLEAIHAAGGSAKAPEGTNKSTPEAMTKRGVLREAEDGSLALTPLGRKYLDKHR